MSTECAVFCYNANGNMTQKIDGSTTSYTYDAENRMTAVSGADAAMFVYDGDGRDLCTPERSERGNRVKGVVGGVTTTYIGNYFEWTPFGKTTLRVQAGSTTTMKKYYYAGGTRVAERVGSGTTYYFLLTDHLGSTSITATRLGVFSSELRYKAWGETRYSSGSTPTTFRYTGQREEGSLGLYWYNSRWYSPALSRFLSADTIIPQPGSPMAWDRYSYVYSNPVRYTDPSGHNPLIGAGIGAKVGGIIYGVTTIASGRDFQWIDLGTSIAVGAVGGALVATGIGAASGLSTLASIGAGTGILGSEFGYSAAAGNEFDSFSKSQN
mgnify:CR=1 FL=1